MAIEITDEGATILVRDTVTDADIFFNKRKANIKRVENKITVQDDRQLDTFLFKDVTIPALGTSVLLAAAIETMLETPADGGGGAASLNTVTFGALTTVQVQDVNTDATGTVIVPANANRKALVLTNSNQEDVWIAIDDTPVPFESFKLQKVAEAATTTTHIAALSAGLNTTQEIRGLCEIGKVSDVTYQEGT